MLRHIVIEGLRFAGESEAEAQERERRCLEHNRRADDLEAANRQPMRAYREWASKHGLKF